MIKKNRALRFLLLFLNFFNTRRHSSILQIGGAQVQVRVINVVVLKVKELKLKRFSTHQFKFSLPVEFIFCLYITTYYFSFELTTLNKCFFIP